MTAARRPGDATAHLRKEVRELIDSHDALLEFVDDITRRLATDLLAPNAAG